LATPFKVATYNVQNLFDNKNQGTEYKDYIPNKSNWTKKISKIKLLNTAETICEINADILALQEIENQNVLKQLLKLLKRVGCPYKYSAISHKKGSAIQVALISKFPIINSKDIQVSYSPRVRNILEVKVNIEDKQLTLFINHWKAKSRNGFESKRIEYAEALKQRLLTLTPNSEYIILGDLNSNYDEHLTTTKKLNNTDGKTAIGDTLKTVKEHKLIDKDQIVNLKNYHYNTWQELEYHLRWNHKFYSHKSTLDHILLPSTLFNGKGIDYVNNSFSVFKSPNLFTKKGYINSWQIKNKKHIGIGYSDHLPIFAYFDTKPFKTLKKQHTLQSKTIEYLYEIEKLNNPIILKSVVVVLKREKYAVIKQSPNGRGIFIYGVADKLVEGNSYDIQVENIHSYKGLKEITKLIVNKQISKVNLNDYYIEDLIPKQNEIIRNIIGTYKNRYFYIKKKKIPIYFKNKEHIPMSGSKLKIDYAHIGYHDGLQLVIYTKKDFKILEN